MRALVLRVCGLGAASVGQAGADTHDPPSLFRTPPQDPPRPQRRTPPPAPPVGPSHTHYPPLAPPFHCQGRAHPATLASVAGYFGVLACMGGVACVWGAGAGL